VTERAVRQMTDDPGGGQLPLPDGSRAARAESYLRRLAERELRWSAAQPDPSSSPADGPPPLAPARAALQRVSAAAGVLDAAGAINADTAAAVIAELMEALTVRSRFPPGFPFPRGRQFPAIAPLHGPVRVVPIGQPVPFAGPGQEGGWLQLLTLTVASGLAVLTYAGRVGGSGGLSRRDELPAEPIGPCGPSASTDGLTFTDDRGLTYQVSISGGGTSDGTWWASESTLAPTPPAGARWIDITPSAGGDPVRIGLGGPDLTGTDLTGPDLTGTDLTGPDLTAAALAGALPPPGLPSAERLIDSLAADLLWSVLWHGRGDRSVALSGGALPTLLAAGAVEPDAPALGRLAAVADRLAVRLPPEVTGRPTDTLPAAWENVLANWERRDDGGLRDGRTGLAPASAVLPETDGAVFAVTGLASADRSLILRVLGWGWSAHRTPGGWDLPWYSWWARDDAGRWHVARPAIAPIARAGGYAVTDLALAPPLHPAATRLEIMMTGPASQARTAIPLSWQRLS
jgi:hypothetical protein